MLLPDGNSDNALPPPGEPAAQLSDDDWAELERDLADEWAEWTPDDTQPGLYDQEWEPGGRHDHD